jgi:prepilin-type processing-associated H-X9-DG protein
VWHGKKMSSVRNLDRTIFALDHHEAVAEGNGDTFDNLYQTGYLPEATSGQTAQMLRHNKAANVLFVDAHVERYSRRDQSESRYWRGGGDQSSEGESCREGPAATAAGPSRVVGYANRG